MGRVLVIGAGGVGNVVVQKCARMPEVFDHITLASRTLPKCRQIKQRTKARWQRNVEIAQVDADKTSEVKRLIERCKPDIVINVALPYQDLSIMDACLATGVHYLDTANYEKRSEAKFCYKWQWAYRSKFRKAGLTAVLGCGFDPGVTNAFCAYAMKKHFDEIHYVDIVDCNAGTHGHPFATNFNPEINIREITQKGSYWEEGRWKQVEPLSVSMDFDYPTIGPRTSYLLFHEELESLVKHIKGLKRIRFWMTFSQNYLTHLRVLESVGMTRITPIRFQGQKIVPLQFLKAVLPDPGSLGKTYSGKTCIGCVMTGVKNGRTSSRFIYNICDHAECFKEVEAQAISYTTGVPAAIGAALVLRGIWKASGVFNVEEFDPEPFMEQLNIHGLPWLDTEYHGTL